MSIAALSVQGLFQANCLQPYSHALLLLPLGKTLPEDMPARSQWLAALKRRDSKPADLARTPLAIDLSEGAVWHV